MSIQTYDNLIDLMKESIYFETKKYNSSFYRKILSNLHTNSYDKSIDFLNSLKSDNSINDLIEILRKIKLPYFKFEEKLKMYKVYNKFIDEIDRIVKIYLSTCPDQLNEFDRIVLEFIEHYFEEIQIYVKDKNFLIDLDNNLDEPYFLDRLKKIKFENCYVVSYLKETNNKDCILHKNINLLKNFHLNFINCAFDNLIINNQEINDINFIDCTFSNIIIKNTLFKSNFFINTTSNNKEIKYILIKDSTFEGKFKLKYCDVENDAFFISNKFKKVSDFYGTTFTNVSFEDTRFYKMTIFSECIIKEKIDFTYTYFFDIVHFRKMIIKDSVEKKDTLNFESTTFEKDSNFLYLASERSDNSNLIKNRETARIIKNSFEQQNNIIEANKFYALEMKEMEKELEFTKRPFEWVVFKTHGLASNHSQEWLLALFWIINLTFITTYLSYELLDEGIVKHLDRGFTFFGGLVALGVVLSKFNEFYRNIGILVSTICIYLFYSDSYIDDKNLKEFSNMLNPFSIMTKGEELTFGILIYKIIIAYLIYQLIISIRQNTRRK